MVRLWEMTEYHPNRLDSPENQDPFQLRVEQVTRHQKTSHEDAYSYRQY